MGCGSHGGTWAKGGQDTTSAGHWASRVHWAGREGRTSVPRCELCYTLVSLENWANQTAALKSPTQGKEAGDSGHPHLFM